MSVCVASMTHQLELIDAPPKYQSHSPTSRAAAESITPHVTHQQSLILKALREHGPLTDEELAEATGLAGNSVRPRRNELWRRGRVVAVGKAQTRSGRAAMTWDVVL